MAKKRVRTEVTTDGSREGGSGAPSGSVREEPQREETGQETEGEEEGVSAKMARRKIMPSSEEIRQHNLSHVPYRNWCPHCVAGRGRSKPHRGHTSEREIPVIGMDFFYFVRDQDEQTRPTYNWNR